MATKEAQQKLILQKYYVKNVYVLRWWKSLSAVQNFQSGSLESAQLYNRSKNKSQVKEKQQKSILQKSNEKKICILTEKRNWKRIITSEKKVFY